MTSSPLLHSLRGLLFGLSCVLSMGAWAQGGTDEQLAAEYMRQGEYAKAILYYEKLYDQQPTAL